MVSVASVNEETEERLAVAPASSTVVVVIVDKRDEDVKMGVACNEVNHEVTCVSSSNILLVKTGSGTEVGSTSVGTVASIAMGDDSN